MKAEGIENFDFFGEDEKAFYKKLTTESVLVQGRHWEKPPYVTILIPTYKRPTLLKQALDSALDQRGYADYQVIVVDNEGRDINESTETSRLMEQYTDEKVIYYRHKEPAKAKMDNVVKTARSKWIVFLHDDDVLSPYHLQIMAGIVRKHRRIKYLAATHEEFYGDNTIKNEQGLENDILSFKLKKYPKSYICLGHVPGWLGAMIDRERYISIGGMPSINTGMGDYCMEGKYIYRYGVYELDMSMPLYFYRIWNKQISAASEERYIWTKVFINKVFYHRYVAAKIHPIKRELWKRIGLHQILSEIISVRKQFGEAGIDWKIFLEECEISFDEFEKNDTYLSDMSKRTLYEIIVDNFWPTIRSSGGITLCS